MVLRPLYPSRHREYTLTGALEIISEFPLPNHKTDPNVSLEPTPPLRRQHLILLFLLPVGVLTEHGVLRSWKLLTSRPGAAPVDAAPAGPPADPVPANTPAAK
jgi:hypothetical protein